MLSKILHIGVIVALVAMAIPAIAQGFEAKNWTNGNEEVLTEDEWVDFSGSLAFTSSAGGISCTTTMTVELEPGSTGKVTEFYPFPTGNCSYSGGIDNLCGTFLSHTSTGLPWTVHATETFGGNYVMRITGLHIDHAATGIFCPRITINGEMTMTADFPHSPFFNSLSGTLSSNLGTEVSASGSFIANLGDYGFET